MVSNTLLHHLSSVLLANTERDVLQQYIQSVLNDISTDIMVALYEPDISRQTLQTVLKLANNKQVLPEFPSFPTADIDSLISHSYVMRTDYKTTRLHSHVSSHKSFQGFQSQFADNPWFSVRVLSSPTDQVVHGVLVCLASCEQSDQVLMAKKSPEFAVLTALLIRAQREDQQSARKYYLQHEAKRQGQHAYQQAQYDELNRQYVGNTNACNKVKKAILHAANNKQAVLIEGETGTGKECIAKLIHHYSVGNNQPFVAINCAALPEDLISVELFGAKKGAYTGSVENKKGLIEAADGGVLFLDEIGEMPINLQATLLRVLNEKSFRRVGEVTERPVDFRLISATNVSLAQHVEGGKFRRDLFYRLCQMRINPPALREHLDDIPLLCQHFLQLYKEKYGHYQLALSEQDIAQLSKHDWPGNVRELENFLYTYFNSLIGQESEHNTLGECLQQWCEYSRLGGSSHLSQQDTLFDSADLRIAVAQFERELISHRLQQYSGNRSLVADSLNLPKRTLAYKCQKLKIDHHEVSV